MFLVLLLKLVVLTSSVQVVSLEASFCTHFFVLELGVLVLVLTHEVLVLVLLDRLSLGLGLGPSLTDPRFECVYEQL